MKILSGNLLIALMLASCTTTGADSWRPAAPADLTGQWELNAVGDEPVRSRTLVISFSPSGQVTGTILCNQFGGEYQVAAGRLTFRRLETTLLGCGGPGMNTLQRQAEPFLRASNAPANVAGSLLVVESNGRRFRLERTG